MGITCKILICGLVAMVYAKRLRSCPQLAPVPVDTNFIFKKQPEDGFYSAYSNGMDSIPDYKPRPMNMKAFEGKREACMKVSIVSSGNELFTGPAIDCTYKQSLSRTGCDIGQLGGANALALRTAGIPRIPKAAIGIIVDTDNSTYLAAAGCVDGAIYIWDILTVYPNYRKVLSRTAYALRVSYKELKETTSWRFRPGRAKIINGSCSSQDRIMAGVEGIRNGITTLFG